MSSLEAPGVKLNRLQWLIIPALFLAGVSAMVVLIPPYENPDENLHFNYSLFFAAELKGNQELARKAFRHSNQEKFQPPLYYLSLAPALWYMAGDDAVALPPINPSFEWKPAPPGRATHHQFLPLEDAKQTKISRAIYPLRIISLAWGLIAAIFSMLLFWELCEGESALALLASGVWNLNPRWLETCASVGNDVAASAMAVIVLWVLIRTLRSNSPPSVFRAACLGVLCALAAYAKMTTAGLIGVVAGTLFICCRTYGQSYLRGVALAATAAICALGLFAPWLMINYILHGDPLVLARELWAPFVATRTETMHPWTFFVEEFQGFRWSYYAVFGQFALLMHPLAYRILDALLLILLVLGIIFWVDLIRRARTWRARLMQYVLPAWLFLGFSSFLSYNSMIYASQGRLIFPAGWYIALLQAGGFLLLFPRKLHRFAAWALLLVMVFWGYYILRYVIWEGFRFLPTGIF